MSRYKCTKDLYQAFLQASSVRYSGLALSEVSPSELSHDSISRWLKEKHFTPKEVWQQAQSLINPTEASLLIVDDSVLDKNFSEKIDLVNYQYSGNAHDVIAGIGLVNLLWHGFEQKQSIPVDYRIYDKGTDGKTKNRHVCEMLSLAKARGLNPDVVVMDEWYSSLQNLKAIRDHGWTWVTTLRKNRKVNRDITLETLTIPDDGLQIHLRGYGWIRVFKFVAKNGRIDYMATNQVTSTRDEVKNIMKARWSIEVYHRELKQTCGIERCQSRTARAQRNHICLAILAWLNKHRYTIRQKISCYQQDWNVIKGAITCEIKSIMAAA